MKPGEGFTLSVTSWEAGRPALQVVRRAVFIVEQQVPDEEEWDEADAASVHVLASLNREPVGTGRLAPDGKIGRIAVNASLRGQGIGTRILRQLIAEGERRGLKDMYLHAQTHALPFYEKQGFRREGEVFDEAGIAHVRMRLAVE